MNKTNIFMIFIFIFSYVKKNKVCIDFDTALFYMWYKYEQKIHSI